MLIRLAARCVSFKHHGELPTATTNEKKSMGGGGASREILDSGIAEVKKKLCIAVSTLGSIEATLKMFIEFFLAGYIYTQMHTR